MGLTPAQCSYPQPIKSRAMMEFGHLWVYGAAYGKCIVALVSAEEVSERYLVGIRIQGIWDWVGGLL